MNDQDQARIPVQSKHQALEWSLVLASQEIETTIVYGEDEASFGLAVRPEDFAKALKTLRQYKIENRGWPWQQHIFARGPLFDWGSVAWVLLLLVFFWLSGAQPGFKPLGIMDGEAVSNGQWWRLFTAVWLHADVAHLGANATLGLVLLGLTMGCYGTGTGLLAAYLAGAGGNAVVWLASWKPHHSLGASGMVMAALGLLAAHSLTLLRQTRHAPKFVFSAIAGGVMLFVLLGLAPGTDVLAHFGGFVCGLLAGAALIALTGGVEKPITNAVSGLLFVTLVLVPWWLALRQ